MKTKSEIIIKFDNAEAAEAALLAMKHEQDFKKRSVSTIIRKNNELIVMVESNDIVSLRASLNAYLRDLQVFEGVNGNDSED